MRNLNLTNSIQGVSGSATKSKEIGWGMLTASVKGRTAFQISVDTFEGEGNSYKERDQPIIAITIPGTDICFTGTIDQLKEKLIANN